MAGFEGLFEGVPKPQMLDEISLIDVVEEGEKAKLVLTIRWLRYCVISGFLDRPRRRGRRVYWDKKYVFAAIASVIYLRDHLNLKRADIATVMKCYKGKESSLLSKIKDFLTKPNFEEHKHRFIETLKQGN